MSVAPHPAAQMLAQASVELRLRLRSPATAIALLLVLALGWWWIPAPDGHAVSLSWKDATGELQTPETGASALGVAGAFLGGFLLMIPAFYLVAGAIGRDRESGLGALLASTPMGKSAYVLGKWLGHCAYLSLLVACAAPLVLFHFAQHGVGAFDAGALLLPLLLFPAPAIPFVAALALAFETTPGLRGRGGLVAAFFALSLLLAVVPMQSSGSLDPEARQQAGRALPAFDPAGLATVEQLLVRSLPAGVHSLATGHIIHSTPPRRVPWSGIAWDAALALRRLAMTLWSAPILLWAILRFDRFAPRRPARRPSAARGAIDPTAPVEPSTATHRPYTSLPAGAARPGSRLAIAAEALLVARSARLPLALAFVASLVGSLLAPAAAQVAAAIALLALAVALAEVGARERIAGTLELVRPLPAIPAVVSLWKGGAAFAVVLLAIAPLALRAAFASPAALLAALLGLLFLATFAVGAARLSGSGRLLLGSYLPLGYAASSGLSPADFTGLVTGSSSLVRSALFAASGVALAALADVVERWRMRG